MTNIARKTRLAQNLEFMKRRFPRHYSFFPCTFVLPKDTVCLRPLFSSEGRSRWTFIVKPDGGSRGRGIFLTRRWEDIEQIDGPCVAQRYVRDPLLIDGKKFDLRLYVLVTSCSPLRAYLFRDGLVRCATENYVRPTSQNLSDRFMHLTNYSINKFSDKFESGGDAEGESGSKRSIRWMLSWLREEYGDNQVDKLWCRIGDVCVKTLLSILPTLDREYETTFGFRGEDCGRDGYVKSANMCDFKADISHSSVDNCSSVPGDIAEEKMNDDGKENARSDNQAKFEHGRTPQSSVSSHPQNFIEGSRCFQILGFDIMIDSRLKPRLIEVNHLPSFATDSHLDESIKSKVVEQALACVKARASDRLVFEELEKRMSKSRLFGTGKASAFSETPNRLVAKEEESGEAGQYACSQSSCNKTASPGKLEKPKNDTSCQKNATPQTAEEILLDIYRNYAPEKQDKVPSLLQKYRCVYTISMPTVLLS